MQKGEINNDNVIKGEEAIFVPCAAPTTTRLWCCLNENPSELLIRWTLGWTFLPFDFVRCPKQSFCLTNALRDRFILNLKCMNFSCYNKSIEFTESLLYNNKSTKNFINTTIHK